MLPLAEAEKQRRFGIVLLLWLNIGAEVLEWVDRSGLVVVRVVGGGKGVAIKR